MTEIPTVTIVIETPLESWAKDTVSFLFAIAIFTPGVLVESSAMQWTGAILFFVGLFARAGGKGLYRKQSIASAQAILADYKARTAGN